MQVDTNTKTAKQAAALIPAIRASQHTEKGFPLVRWLGDVKLSTEAKDSLIIRNIEANADDEFFRNLGAADIAQVPGLGSFIIGCTYDPLMHISSLFGVNYKPVKKRELPFYKRMFQKIVIVTGSAQGFGQGIAEELAREGAYVVIAEMNLPLARKVADDINSDLGDGTAFAVEVDVSNEESMEALINRVVL